MNYKLRWYPKLFNHVTLFAGSKTLGIFYWMVLNLLVVSKLFNQLFKSLKENHKLSYPFNSPIISKLEAILKYF